MRYSSFLIGTIVTKRGRFITNWAFCYNKSGQRLLQIGVTLVITNQGSGITNQGSLYIRIGAAVYYKFVHHKNIILGER